MAQRTRFATPPSRHTQQSDPPSAFTVGQVPIDAQELAPGAIDDPSKVLPGVLTSALANPLDTPAKVNQGSAVFATGIIADGSAWLSLVWGAVSGATGYEVRWKLHTDSIYQYARVNGTTFKIYGLLPNTAYDVNIASVNAFNNTSGYPDPDFAQATAADSTAPATPASVAASAGVRSVIVTFNANTEVDLDHYVIEVYSDAGLTTLVKTFTGLATVWAYNNGTASTQYWARVKAVDTSGNSSAWSSTVTATTGQIANSDIQAGTITADRLVAATITAASGILADAVITTAKIADLAVTNAKVNDLAVGKLTAGTLTAAVILSGSIKTGSSGPRVEMDANGIRLYGYTPPRFRSAGSMTGGAAAITPPLPAGWLANDIFVLVVQTANQTVTAPTGWTLAANSAQGTGVAGAAGSVGIAVFWRRAVGGDTAPTVADTGDHQTAQIFAFYNCITTGTPFDATAGSVDAVSNTSATLPAATTTYPDTLVVGVAGHATSTTVGQFSNWANSALGGIEKISDSGDTTGVGGGYGVFGGFVGPIGNFGTTAVTLATASKKAMWVGALIPDESGGAIATVNLDSLSGAGTFIGALQTGSNSEPHMILQQSIDAQYGTLGVLDMYGGTDGSQHVGKLAAYYYASSSTSAIRMFVAPEATNRGWVVLTLSSSPSVGGTLDVSVADTAGAIQAATFSIAGGANSLQLKGVTRMPDHDAGYMPFAYPVGYGVVSTTATLALAANGGAMAVPVLLTAPMQLDGVTVRNGDATLSRPWEWRLYKDDQSSGTLNEVVNANGNETFTATVASNRTASAQSPPVYLTPGLYWLVVRNTHATNTWTIVEAPGNSFTDNKRQIKTLGTGLAGALDFVTGWTKGGDTPFVRLNGRVFAQASGY